MNIPVTRRKLSEAEFFLRYMEAETRRSPPANPRERDDRRDVFSYFLSAFVNAARSVPWVFQAEDRPLYDRVQPGWNASLSEDDRAFLKLMNERRLDEVKRTGAVVKYDVTTVPVTGTAGAPHLQMVQIMWSSEGGPVPQVAVLVPRFQIGNEPLEVIPSCRKYVGLLEVLVRAGESANP